MIYFFNNDLGLEKVVTSSNVLMGNHEHELNNLIRADVVLDLKHALSFIDDVDFFGYYYKDVFYLHKITRQESEHEAEVMVIAGRHIFFEDMLYSEVIKDIRPQNREAKYMLDQAIGGHTRWNVVMTDVTGTLSTNFYWQMPYEALEWIVEHFRLEYLPVILFDGQKINGYELHVKKRLGENKGIRIPWGERVEKLNYEVDFSEIVTQLAPRGKGEEIGEDIYSRRINISDVNFSRNGVVSPVGNLYLEDKSLTAKYGNDGGKPRKGEGEFYDIDDVNELAEAGYQMYLDVSRPQVVISADVVDIGDVTIGDGVNIIRREHDLYFEARVHKISVDLLNPDDAQVELGDYEHFKESKVQKSNKKRIEIIEKEVYGQIHQYKIEFDENFDSVVNQWREEQEQAIIDAHAEIAAAEVRMTELIDTERNQMMEDYNEKVEAARQHAEQQAAEKADTVQSNLEEATSTHQALIDGLKDDVVNFDDFIGEINQDIEDIFGNVGNINDFIGDTTVTLTERMNDLRSTLDTDLENVRSDLQGKLDGVESGLGTVGSDLDTARSELQQQLDKARADLEGIEVGGRNLVENSSFKIGDLTHWTLSPRSRGTVVESDEEFQSDNAVLLDGDGGSVELSPSKGFDVGEYIVTIWYKHLEGHTAYLFGGSGYGRHGSASIFEEGDGETLQKVVFKMTIENNGDRMPRIRYAGSLPADHTVGKSIVYAVKIEKGNKATDWTPAPEDTEAKITTLSDSIEYIDGQLEAKLNRTEIEPIQNKITEYGTTLDANAESIGLLQEKTELHDDDITKWSNLTESTAEGLSQSITRISNVEGDVNSVSNDLIETAEEVTRTISRLGTVEGSLSSAETQIEANADGLSALTNRTIENEDLISDMQTEISTNASAIELRATKTELNTTNTRLNVAESKLTIEADWIGSLVSEVDDASTKITAIDQTVDSITQTVGEHDDWFGTHGSEVEQTVEGFNQKVWLSDVAEIGANLIPFSDVTVEENRERWTAWNNMPIGRWHDNLGYLNIDVPSSHSSIFITVRSEEFDVIPGEIYTLSFLARTSSSWNTNENMNYTFRLYSGESNSAIYFTSGDGQIEDLTSRLSGLKRYSRSFVANHSKVRIMIGTRKLETGKYARFSFKEPKLELGDTATPYINAISHIEHLAHKINMRVIEIDSGTVTKAELNVQADRIDSMVDQVSDIESNYGSLITQTADQISSKIWLNDVADIQPNLIPHSNFDYPNARYQWSTANGNATAVDSDGFYTVRHTNAESTLGMYSPYFNIEEGYEYTLSVLVKNTNYASVNYHWTALTGDATTWIGAPTRQTHIDGIIYKNEYTFVANGTGRARVRIGAYVISGNNVSVRIKEPKIERGSTSTPFLNAFSAIEQEADRIRLMVQGDGESGYLTQSDITLEPDQIRIGSQQIGGQDLASVISVSPRAIEMIAEEINFTGNVNVKGKIESIAMSAVNAEFANLFADQVEAGVIEASHIEGLTARFEWLYTLNANMEKLVSQNVFTNAVDAISIEAVYANISSVRTRLLTAGVIDAKHLNVNYAMIDELFAYEGRISRLTSKTAFVRDIQSIEVTARQLNLNTLTNRMNQIEGGLMIKRPDGAVSVNNGVLRPTFNIGFIQPHWMGVGVRTSGNYFRTNETSYVSATGFSYEQSGRYLTIIGKAEMRGDVAGASRNTIGAIRLHGYSGTNKSTFVYIDSRNDNNGNNQDFNITIDMGRPDYKVKHFYVQFYTANAESSANFRINQAYQYG